MGGGGLVVPLDGARFCALAGLASVWTLCFRLGAFLFIGTCISSSVMLRTSGESAALEAVAAFIPRPGG